MTSIIDCSFPQSLHWKSSLHVLSKSLEISFIVHTAIYLFLKKRVCVKTGDSVVVVVIKMMDYWSRRFLTSAWIRTCSSAGSAIAFRCSRISFSVNSLNTLSSENTHRDTLFSLCQLAFDGSLHLRCTGISPASSKQAKLHRLNIFPARQDFSAELFIR